VLFTIVAAFLMIQITTVIVETATEMAAMAVIRVLFLPLSRAKFPRRWDMETKRLECPTSSLFP
jgi:hypothetical protein